MCDHARESGHNAATTLHERLLCIGADWPSRVAAEFARLLGTSVTGAAASAAWRLFTSTDDMKKAYRCFPCAQPEYTAVALLHPETRRVAYFLLHGFNFGLISAVNGFNRVPCFLTVCAELEPAACRR